MVSQRMLQLGTARSVIRELFEYGRQRAAEVGAENVFDFSLGNPSVPAPAEVNDTAIRLLREQADTIHCYTSAPGDPAARQRIADSLNRRFGEQYTADELYLTVGAAASLCCVLGGLTCPGDEYILFAPYFPEYRVFIEGVKGKVKVISPELEHFQIDFSAFEQAVTCRTKGVIINSPNNPSGVVYSRQTLETLAAILRAKEALYGHPIYLISDEPYRELAYGVEVPFLPEIYRDTVICYSYSKSLSLPGERIGYVYVPQKATDGKALYSAVAGAARAGGHVCAPSLWQKVIARCAHLRPDLESYDRNRKALYEGLTRMGYEMAKPDGAFYLFIKAPGGDANAFSDAAKKKDLLVVPGDGFGCPGYFRICYCVSLEMIQKSLPVFEELIRCGEW